MQLISSLSVALMAGCARAFVVPAVPMKSFVQPARAALSTLAASPSPQMKIAIVTVSSCKLRGRGGGEQP